MCARCLEVERLPSPLNAESQLSPNTYLLLDDNDGGDGGDGDDLKVV